MSRRWKTIPGCGLDCTEPVGNRSPGSRRETCRRARIRRAIDVRVDGQRVADLATEEDVGRHIECLAGEIPERLFDRAERGGRNETLSRHRLAALSIGFDLEWRTPVDQIEERRQLQSHARSIVCSRVREAEGIRCFAKPDKTGVRPETHDQPDRS